MDQLLLIRREERFGYSIIVTDPGPSEGSPDIVPGAVLIEYGGRILAAAVRMKYHPGRRLPGSNGHVESGDDQAGPHKRGDSPADYLARGKVDNGYKRVPSIRLLYVGVSPAPMLVRERDSDV